MKFKINIFLIALSLLYSCTDVIPIKLDKGEDQLIVDGSITYHTNLSAAAQLPDTIILLITPGYLDENPAPRVKDAEVIISDNEGHVDTLTNLNNGKYVTNTLPDKIGSTYFIKIKYRGDVYTSQSKLNPVAAIDSLVPLYKTEELFGREPGYYVDLYANDLPGVGNYYRIKVYKDGKLYNRPIELNIAEDAGFVSAGGGSPDGQRFIYPIRDLVNPENNDKKTNKNLAPFLVNDTVKVEIESLTAEHARFYVDVQVQINNANSGLFASPYTNVSTDIVNTTTPSKKGTGWFGASAISTATVIIK